MSDWQDDCAPDFVMLRPARTLVARKAHACDCRLRGCDDIQAGQRYEQVVAVEDGEFRVLRFGKECGGSLHRTMHGDCSA